MLQFFVRIPSLILMGAVRLYQLTISPWLPASCRYSPTCSQYAIEALKKYGAVKGSVLAVHRLLRCNPWGGQGYDPPRWYGEERRNDIPSVSSKAERTP